MVTNEKNDLSSYGQCKYRVPVEITQKHQEYQDFPQK